MSSPIRIATRASALALWQAEHTRSLLASATDRPVEIVHITTRGDKDRTNTLRSFGGTGAFTREVQVAVLEENADLAVHSLKDLPTEPHPELTIGGVPERASRFDALVLPAVAATEGVDVPVSARPLPRLRHGAVIGSGSVRRAAQLLAIRPDLDIREIRGNVETRIRRVDDGDFDATILAMAGLHRLGKSDRISIPLLPPIMYPAVGQGALAWECRTGDADLISLLNRLSDAEALRAVTVERELLRQLRAGCHAPVGVLYEETEETGILTAVVLDLQGRVKLTVTESVPMSELETLADRTVRQLEAFGVERLLQNDRSD